MSMYRIRKLDMRGIGHHLVIALVVVTGVAGFGAYRVFSSSANTVYSSATVIDKNTKDWCELLGRNWKGNDCKKDSCPKGVNAIGNGNKQYCKGYVAEDMTIATCQNAKRMWLQEVGCAKTNKSVDNAKQCQIDNGYTKYIVDAKAKLDICKDVKAPIVAITAPANRAQVAVDDKIAVSVTSKDAAGIKNVDVSVNSKKVATLTSAPYQYTLDTTGMTDTVVLTADSYDPSGNKSSASVTIHIAAKELLISGLKEGARVAGTVNLTAAAVLPSGQTLSNIQYIVDKSAAVQGVGGSHSYGLDTNKLTDGAHVLTVTAHNSSTKLPLMSKTINFTVANAPEFTISPASGGTLGVVNGNFKHTISVTQTDGSDMSSVKIEVPRKKGTYTTTITQAPFQYVWDISTVSLGNATIKVTATDKAGNTSTKTATFKIKL